MSDARPLAVPAALVLTVATVAASRCLALGQLAARRMQQKDALRAQLDAARRGAAVARCPRADATGRAGATGASPRSGDYDAARQILIDNQVHARPRRLPRRDAARARRRPRRARRSRLGRRRPHSRRPAAGVAAAGGTRRRVPRHRVVPPRAISSSRADAPPSAGLAEPRSSRAIAAARARGAADRRRADRATPADGLVRDWPARRRRREAPDLHGAVVRVRGARRGAVAVYVVAQRSSGMTARRPDAARATPRAAGDAHALIAVVRVAPVVASYAAYYFFPRGTRANYGELLPTPPAPAVAGTRSTARRSARRPARQVGAACRSPRRVRRRLRGRALRDAPGAHDAGRRTRARRARVARHRRRRAAAGAARGSIRTLVVVRDDAGSSSRRCPGRARDRIYLVDPLGNLVLAFPRDPDIKADGQGPARGC